MQQSSSYPIPWTILICADLGYISEAPEEITTENWDLFLKTHRIRIQERIDSFLPQSASPFTTDYEISSLKDFSSDRCCKKLPVLGPIIRTKEALMRYIEGLQDLSATVQTISQNNLPQPLKNRILKAVELDTTGSVKKPTRDPDRIDTILARIDLKAPTVQEGPYPLDKLLKLAHTEEKTGPERKFVRIRSIIRELDIYSESMVSAVQECPPFFHKKSTWKALELLCRSTTRKKTVELFVHSLPRNRAEESFETVVEQLCLQNKIPDIVIWDHEIRFNATGEKVLKGLARTAYNHTFTVFASLSDQEFIKSQNHTISCRTVSSEKFRSFNRLRKDEIFRSLALFGPAVFYESEDASNDVFRCGGAWLMAEQFMHTVSSGIFPLDLSSSMIKGHFQPIARLGAEEAQKAARNGITLFSLSDSGSVKADAICAFKAPGSRPILSMLDFNLLLNRFSKLAVTRSHSREFLILKHYLETQLQPFHIFAHSSPKTHGSGSESQDWRNR
ncbi:MAG: hypothetical protein ACLFVQ_00290 [Chitinispirillaceae bacterium]